LNQLTIEMGSVAKFERASKNWNIVLLLVRFGARFPEISTFLANYDAGFKTLSNKVRTGEEQYSLNKTLQQNLMALGLVLDSL
jgi:hypothetical protein